MDPHLQASSSSCANTMSSGQSSNSKVIKLNDSVYELHRPTGTPSVQVLLFHGLQFQGCSDPHLSTWEAGDGSSQLWPQTWLLDKFPDAHVLSISYDALVVKGDGKLDLYVIVENLASDLLSCKANIGQEEGCPLILVGHCFGGLVIKRLCLKMHDMLGRNKSVNFVHAKVSKFLRSVKGIFYYGTPHHGVSSEIAKHFVQGPLLEFVEVLSTATGRLNHEFNNLRHGCYQNAWSIAGVAENLPTKLGTGMGARSVVVVQEASTREGDMFHVAQGTDHISISKPKGKQSRSFYDLADHVQHIVKQSKVNLPAHQCQGLPRYSVELAERAQEIERKLQNAPVLGIVGMGGVGKTTLVKAVFNNISKEYEYTCFVDNVKEIPKRALEDSVLSQFHRNGSRVDGPKPEWPHLGGKKMLLVLDDIDSEEQLVFLPPLDIFGDQSRVIITSRVQSVLKVFDISVCHEVQFLSNDNAQKLFCKHAFLQEEIPTFFKKRKLVGDVVRKCGGLPLTLEVMGRYLRGHDCNNNFWEETICRLGEAQAITGDQKDRVWATLRVSTDALVNGEKEMFISAATYCFEMPLERALAAWSMTCGNSETGWANLLSKCLVKEVYKSKFSIDDRKHIEWKTVWVHEHLRDLADKILSPRNRLDSSDIKSSQEIVEQLNSNLVDVKTEFLNLSYKYSTMETKILYRSLLNMEQLKYMELHSVLPEGSPKKFPKNLSLLTWKRGREQGLEFPVSCIEEMEKLAVLDLKGWETPHTFSVALGKLTNLRILCLKSMTPVAQRKLADLCTSCFQSREEGDLLPEDLSQLSRLQRMEVVGLGILKLPESFGSLSSLKILTLKDVGLFNLPESFGNLSTLEKLSLLNLPLLGLPESFGKLSSLVVLIIKRCQNLVILPESFGRLLSLEVLTLDSDVKFQGKLKSLPDTFGQLRALKKLTMFQRNLQSLPSTFCDLESMQELKIGADGLETLPENLGALKSLQDLDLFVPIVKTLPTSVGKLSSLRKLNFTSFVAEELPRSLWQLASLQDLTLEVDLLKALSEKVGELSSLRELSFGSSGAKMLPEELGHLVFLRGLTLTCPNVKKLPNGLERLSSLEDLAIYRANNLVSLPQGLGNLPRLTKLTISDWKLQYLPVVGWGNLSRLYLSNCRKLRSLPDCLGRRVSNQEIPNTHISNTSSNRMRLYVQDCPLLDKLELNSFVGWHKESLGALYTLWRRK